MPYELYQFGSLVLPEYDGDEDVSTGQVAPVILDLPGGGVFDVLGPDPAARRTTPLNKVCTLLADDSAALRTAYNALRAKNGRRDRLWRRWDDGTTEWCWARLVNISARRPTGQPLEQDADLQFVMISPHWFGAHHGAAWLLDSGILLDLGYPLDTVETIPLVGGSNTLTVSNGGHRATHLVGVRVSATWNITALKITVTGISEMQYTGTIYAGTALTIDTGALSVTLDGNEAYVYFSLTANHKRDDWLRLEPGANTIIVFATCAGAGTIGSATFDFWDAWE